MTWWRRLWRRRRMEEQLDKELLFHLDQHASDLVAQGHSPEDARREAVIALGGPDQVKEACRDARGTRWLEDLLQDFRYAIRTLRKQPGFGAVALLTLGLGIGATTVMFTVVNGVLLKPLPYPEPRKLVTLDEQTERVSSPIWGNLWAFAYPNYLDCRRESRSLDMAAWQDVLDHARRVPGVLSAATVDTVPMREGNNPIGYWNTPAVPPPDEQPLALANSVTPDYLKVMGIPLLKGRFFDDHDRLGNELVVVIDDVLAQFAFGRQDPIGKRLWIPESGSPFSGADAKGPDVVRVVGVVGHVRYWGLAGDDQAKVRAQFYYSFAQVPDPLLPRWSELMSIAVRTSVAPLNVVEPLRRAVRGATGGPKGDQALYQVPTMEQLASDSLGRQRFLTLVFAVFAGLALLLACIGIYGVLAYLTRRRVPEIGVRMALGASAVEVVWLVLRQSLWMILVGVGAGILGSLSAGRLLQHLVDGVQPTGPATIATVIPVLVVAALLASLGPALAASHVDPIDALRQE